MYYLGTITGSSGACNNSMTGVSGLGTFKVPQNNKALYLMPSATGIQFELFAATGISSLTTAGRGAFLDGPNLVNGPFRTVAAGPSGAAAVISIYNAAGGFVSVNIYAAPTS